MALSESIEYDKIEVVGQYKAVQVRKATVIKKDGTELTRSFHRYVLQPDSDISYSAEPAEITAICNAVWTKGKRSVENLPRILIPNVPKIETISIPLPTADVPSYVPLVVPPSDLREPEGTEPEATETTEQPAPSINIPMINIDVPLPTTEVVVAATMQRYLP